MSEFGQGSLGRRRFLARGGGAALALGLGLAATPSAPVWAQPRFRSNPFALGIASGDPLPDGVVLWTRLAPDPLAEDGFGGMPNRTVPVAWQVAEDPRFRRVVRSGAQPTDRTVAHSIHADVRGLRPGRDYFYRFRVGSEVSPVGRTRTAPASGAPTSSMSFAFASCASLNHGQFTPYHHLAQEDLDAVVFLGDYLYANSARTLADFRAHHGLYKSDPNLQAAHRATPWIVTIDDNDITNNWWGRDPNQTELLAMGLRAFWEHMPLRMSSRPTGTEMALYRRLTFGDLATFNVLDTRQYRHEQSERCALEERSPEGYCPAQLDPNRTILGENQERWLLDGLSASTSGWNVLANQMFFTQRDRDFDPDPRRREFNVDGWDGYVADRQTLLDHVQAEEITNLVVITGDSHRNWVLNTPPSYRDWGADTPPVATEFMVTSVTSGRDRPLRQVFQPEAENTPHLLYRDASHGYARVTLTHDTWTTDFRAVSTVEAPQADIRTLTSWVVENGRPGPFWPRGDPSSSLGERVRGASSTGSGWLSYPQPRKDLHVNHAVARRGLIAGGAAVLAAPERWLERRRFIRRTQHCAPATTSWAGPSSSG